jgi:glycosyltransferase 2 family protein
LPFTLSEAGTLPANIQTAARVSGILAVSATVALIVAANQRPLANRIIRFFLERISFLDTESWSKRADDILAGLGSLTRLRDGLILLVLSILVWIPILFAYFTGMRAVHLEPTWAIAGFTVCAAALSISVPSSPGQLGVFHAGVIFALTEILGQPEAASTGFAFLYHALNLVIMIILGVIGINGTSSTFGDLVATTQAFVGTKAKAN